MTTSPHLYWDSCVFIRHVTRSGDWLTDIDDFVVDARKGNRTIYYSTIVIAEFRPSLFRGAAVGTFEDLLADLGAAFVAIEPTPDIMADAARLKDAIPTNPNPKEPKKRVIGTADAIHLATCLWIKEALDLPNIVLHSFDEGRNATWEGRCVPIVGFENWFPPPSRSRLVQDVCNLRRERPLFPQANLLAGLTDGRPIELKPSAEGGPTGGVHSPTGDDGNSAGKSRPIQPSGQSGS